MDRRGQGTQVINILEVAVLTAIVFIVVVTFTSMYVQQKSDTRLAQLAVYDRLFMYGAGFHAQDARTGQPQPFVVDLDRFTDQSADDMLGHPDNKFVAGRLVLVDLNASNNRMIYWNKQWYDIYAPLSTKRGGGASLSVPYSHNVLIRVGSEYHPGILWVEGVAPS